MALSTSRDCYKIIFLCIAWYISSSANNIVGKIILNDFPYPMTVSMVQLVSITLYSMPILKLWQIPEANKLPVKYWVTMILPLAGGKFFASVSSHISIWKVPVSYAHTVKATLPFFTVILSRLILKEKQTLKVYLSLVPIIGGVLIATVTELSFDKIGLVSALAATVGFSLQSIFSKKCLKETGLHHLRLLFILSFLCTVCFTPLWFFRDFTEIIKDSSLIHSTHTPRLIALLLIDGFCNFSQNVIAFTVIALLMPVSYAVANATKRISIITVSLITLKNPVSLPNIVGMLVAVIGVFAYNKAKYDQRQLQKQQTVLPSTANGLLSGQQPLLLQNNYSQAGFQDKVYFNAPPTVRLTDTTNTNVNHQLNSMLQVPISRMPKAFSVVSLDSMT